MSSSVVTAFLGALQASLAVLLTIFYGVVAAQYKLLSESTAKDISKTCVRMFLPALLIHNVGSQLHADTGMKYVPILIWSIAYNGISIVIGVFSTRFFKLPGWVAPAISFNNTTSLPLLLIQSLDATGILKGLDSSPDVIARAKSYFLVNAIVSNSLTFALGPKLLNGFEEDAPDTDEKEDNNNDESEEQEGDVEQGNEQNGNDVGGEDGAADEHTSLLPSALNRQASKAKNKSSKHTSHYYKKLPSWAQQTLSFLYSFLNAPLIGAVIGAIIGLIGPLHKAFFSSPEYGGIFTAWLTSSIKNIGDLFATLQVAVVGVKLAHSMRRMARGESSGSVPWPTFGFIMTIRFVVWPLISIPLIWALATKTSVLDNDPILWFAMMLMPAGPPAMKLTALADVSGSDDEEKMSIAKFLTIAYAVSPLIAFSVVGSLKAAEAAKGA